VDDRDRNRGGVYRHGIAGGLGVADTKGVDWVEWLIQIALAAFGVAALSKVKVRH
jgi:hypothetical protein